MHGDMLTTTLTTRFAYKLVWIDSAQWYAGDCFKTSQNQLWLVGFIDSSRSRGTWPIARLGGWRHWLLGISYATHLAPRLGGWIRHGSQQWRLHATILWTLYSKTWGFWFKARGLWDICHEWLNFQICWKIRTEDSRLNWPSAWFFEST
jgi:hypothetical protein